HASDQLLVLAEAVERGGVEEVVADVERGEQRALGFGRVRRAIGVRHAHAAKADGVDAEGSKFACFHVGNSPVAPGTACTVPGSCGRTFLTWCGSGSVRAGPAFPWPAGTGRCWRWARGLHGWRR